MWKHRRRRSEDDTIQLERKMERRSRRWNRNLQRWVKRDGEGVKERSSRWRCWGLESRVEAEDGRDLFLTSAGSHLLFTRRRLPSCSSRAGFQSASTPPSLSAIVTAERRRRTPPLPPRFNLLGVEITQPGTSLQSENWKCCLSEKLLIILNWLVTAWWLSTASCSMFYTEATSSFLF